MTTAVASIAADDLEYVERIPLPPESLRHRVHGAADVESFLEVGRQCSQDIVAGLKRIGREPGSFESVLDFGCGCGRVLRRLKSEFGRARLFGTDIDLQAIAWCGKNLPGIAFCLNAGLPPTGYASQSFDLICAVSVFSHLNESYQFYWLNELRRMAKPNGIVLLSIHGSYYLNHLSAEMVDRIKSQGMKFVVADGWQNIFPEWYQGAFHTKEYVLDHCERYFNILDYIPGGMNGVQDFVVLQRRSEENPVLDHELVSRVTISRLESRLSALERTLEIKNRHILYLEQLVKALESGRVMRLMRAMTR